MHKVDVDLSTLTMAIFQKNARRKDVVLSGPPVKLRLNFLLQHLENAAQSWPSEQDCLKITGNPTRTVEDNDDVFSQLHQVGVQSWHKFLGFFGHPVTSEKSADEAKS